MGTNYYIESKSARGAEGTHTHHIGKASAGWHFALHVTDELRSLDDWLPVLEKGPIVNEYGEPVYFDEMLGLIKNRAWPRPIIERPITPKWLSSNSAEPGVNNLIRAKIDGVHCVGHGEGAWDYIAGDFS